VAVIIAFAVITGMHIVLGELAPKSVALFTPEWTALYTVPPTEVFRIIFYPAIWLLNGLANATLRPFRVRVVEGGAHSAHTAEEISLLVTQSKAAGALEEQEAELLSGVFTFGDRRVNEVMIPRTEVRWLDKGTALSDFYAAYLQSPHSRFPVCEGSRDNVVGIVNIKDVLKGLADGSLASESMIDEAMRAALFIPETKFVGAAFFDLQQTGHQMAVVVDEYGGTAGIVTLEMLLEELVGYVSDELRRHEEQITELDERTYRVDAGMTVKDANEELDIDLPEGEDYETLAGLVLSRLGHIPAAGEQVTHDGLAITVTRVDGNRVEEVTITKLST
jgi:CBS domain containing-hemolysin-like protein